MISHATSYFDCLEGMRAMLTRSTRRRAPLFEVVELRTEHPPPAEPFPHAYGMWRRNTDRPLKVADKRIVPTPKPRAA